MHHHSPSRIQTVASTEIEMFLVNLPPTSFSSVISIYLSIYLSVYLSMYLSVCLSIYLLGIQMYPILIHPPQRYPNDASRNCCPPHNKNLKSMMEHPILIHALAQCSNMPHPSATGSGRSGSRLGPGAIEDRVNVTCSHQANQPVTRGLVLGVIFRRSSADSTGMEACCDDRRQRIHWAFYLPTTWMFHDVS